MLRPREYHDQLVSKGQRIDGRRLDEARELKLETNAIRTADSSALVKLGNTSLICGCTTRFEPEDEKYDDLDGLIKIKVELPPICSGPTGHKMQQTTQLLGRYLRNILQDSDCIDKSSLYVNGNVWKIDIEVICLNYDGSLLDASLIAVLAALKSLNTSDRFNDTLKPNITLNTTPVTQSFASIGDKIICDPNLEEETVASSTFTVTIDPKSDRCCHINKIGGKPITCDSLYECIQLAKHRAFKLRKILESTNENVSMDCS